MNSNTSLAFFGERCGSSWDRFRWTGVYSVWRGTGQLYSSSCVWLRPNTTNDTSLANIFGDCGVAPLLFPELPTKVCKESAGEPLLQLLQSCHHICCLPECLSDHKEKEHVSAAVSVPSN